MGPHCAPSLSLQGTPLPPALCPPLASGGPDYRPHPPHHEALDHLLEPKVCLSPPACCNQQSTDWAVGEEMPIRSSPVFAGFGGWVKALRVFLCAPGDPNRSKLQPQGIQLWEPTVCVSCQHLFPTPHLVLSHWEFNTNEPRGSIYTTGIGQLDWHTAGCRAGLSSVPPLGSCLPSNIFYLLLFLFLLFPPFTLSFPFVLVFLLSFTAFWIRVCILFM